MTSDQTAPDDLGDVAEPADAGCPDDACRPQLYIGDDVEAPHTEIEVCP